MKNFLLILLPLIGLFIGYFLGQPSDFEKEATLSLQERNLSFQENALKYDLAKKKLELFTEKQMNEYHSLLGEKEKYKKADDILSKVMLIFLADLGLHLSQKNKDWVKDKRVEKTENQEKAKPFIATPKELQERERIDEPAPDLENVIYGYDQEPNQKEEQRIILNKKRREFRYFFDKLGRRIRSLIPIQNNFNILASNKIYKGKTKPANKELIKFYLGNKSGWLRRGLKSNLKMTYRLKIDAKSLIDPYNVKLKFHAFGDSYTAIQINDKFEVVHPDNHNSQEPESCQLLILKGKNGLHLYLTYINSQKKIFGRVVNINRKRPTLGYFLLDKLRVKK